MNAGSESGLISRCLRGEAEAWDELFDRHYNPTARFIFQVAPEFNRDDVEEVCQEVFLSVIQHLGSFQGNSQLQTWICRIAANKARDCRQKLHAAKRGGGQKPLSLQAEDPETGLTLDPPSDAPGPDAGLISRERLGLLREALDQLGAPCREIIELRYFGDRSYEELSRELQLNPKTVSSRLSKCLDKLENITRTVFARENSAPFSVQHD